MVVKLSEEITQELVMSFRTKDGIATGGFISSALYKRIQSVPHYGLLFTSDDPYEDGRWVELTKATINYLTSQL